jgi:hypothetical protein
LRGGPRRFRPGFPCPAVLRIASGSACSFAYGAFTLSGASFHPLPLPHTFVTPRPCCGTIKKRPTTPHRQRPQAIAPTRFGLIPVRSPLLRESRFLSLPRATKMFQFARCTSTAPMDSVQGTRALPRVGFPIRKSPDQCLFSGSPRLIAAVHVLHRLLVPRHPPCALVLLFSRRSFFERTPTTAMQFSRYARAARPPS